MASRPLHDVTPLLSVQDPRDVWAVQPTFLMAEVLFLGLAVLALVDAARRPRGALVFTACLVGGGAIELVTILHGEVGNFYHSQASVMLFGKREPLYMLAGCYGWLVYAVVTCSQHLTALSPITQSAFAALLGGEAWALLDTVGAKFLWWTWHTDEPLYAHRELGVPTASSFWVMASIGSLSFALSELTPHRASVAWGAFVGPLATLGLMNIPFFAVYHPLVTYAGLDGGVALWTLRAACILVLLPRFSIAASNPDPKLLRQLCVYAALMLMIAVGFDPTAETRTSFGQPCVKGKCSGTESSFWGAYTRRAAVCPASNTPADGYRLCGGDCGGSEWYTTCGVEKDMGWMLAVAAHAAAVVALALMPFGGKGVRVNRMSYSRAKPKQG